MTGSLNLACSISADGVLKAEVPAGYELVGDFLVSDMQDRIDWVDTVLDALPAVRATGIPYARDGNAFVLTVTADWAFLQHQYSDASTRIRPSELKSVLLTWRDFVYRVDRSG